VLHRIEQFSLVEVAHACAVSLATVKLLASSLRLSSAIRDGEPPAHHLEVSAAAMRDEETAYGEPRWGDAGYDASPSRAP
jgi:hypothetical protein